MASGPFQSRIQVWHLDDAETSEKLFRLGIWTIVNLPFSVADRDSRRCPRRLQSRTADKDARGCVIAAVEVFLWLVNE